MATIPGGGPSGGGMLTGDPDLEAYGAGVIPGGGGVNSGPQLGPAASLWAGYFQSKIPNSPTFATNDMLNQAAGRPGYGTTPGSIGYGVLQPGGASGTPGDDSGKFYASPDGQQARGEAFPEIQDKDRTRLQQFADDILGRTATPAEVADIWAWAVEQVDAAEQLGNEPMDPWHWLEQRKATEEEARLEEEPQPRTVIQTQRTINLTDPTSANAIVDTTLRNLLGRAASDEEKQQFRDALKTEEEANPTVTTTTTDYNADSTVIDSTSETTGGGPDPGAYAQEHAEDNFETEAQIMRAASYYDVMAGL